MRIYIGYKFSGIENKEDLKAQTLSLAKNIEALGFKTFVLGRDIQNWHSSPFPMLKTIPHVVLNMIKADYFLSFITDDTKSTGLLVESLLATLFLKKRGILHKKGTSKNIYALNIDPEHILEFDSEDELQSACKKLLIITNKTPEFAHN